MVSDNVLHVFQLADMFSKHAGLVILIDVPVPNVSHGEFTNVIQIM